MYEDGYAIVGFSSFSGPSINADKAKKQAKRIKAEIVIYTSSYERTRSGGMPMMMPNNTTTTMNANVYGSGGVGGFGGTANTYGTTPVVVPFSVDSYHTTAYYFSRVRPEKIGWGLRWNTLTPEQARAVGTNKAMVVYAVVRNSPAFDADIFPGDIILTVGGRDVSSPERSSQVKADFAGQTVPIELIRDGQPKTLQIAIPAPSAIP